MSNIIIFGKYKNQPFDVLLKDTSYMKWLMTQTWTKNKYPQLYNFLKAKHHINVSN
jgi:hypothetical protein